MEIDVFPPPKRKAEPAVPLQKRGDFVEAVIQKKRKRKGGGRSKFAFGGRL